MRRATLHATAAVLALFWGVSSSTYLMVGRWWSLVPWGLSGILVGLAAGAKKDSLSAGALYGAVLPVSFMLAGYRGAWTAARLGPLLVFCLVLAVIGIGCGCALTLAGRWCRRFLPPPRKEKTA